MSGDLPEVAAISAPTQVVLCDVLLASLETLARAGDVDMACRLAGRACAALRKDDAKQWRRFNALLHRLSRMTGELRRPSDTDGFEILR
ncbi:MAG: hypothetical protein AB7K64_21110 [Variibacter sp.]